MTEREKEKENEKERERESQVKRRVYRVEAH